MPVPDLLGTRRLRREIDAQSQQFERDIERVKLTSTQLQHTAVARVTSPLGLLSAIAAGFIAGKIAGRPAHPKPLSKHAIGSIAALTLNTARSIGIQVVLPMAIEWAQSKFAKHKAAEETTTTAKTEGDITSHHAP